MHSQQIMKGNHQKIACRNNYLICFICPGFINHREGKTHYSFTFLGRNNYLIFFIYPGFINHRLRLCIYVYNGMYTTFCHQFIIVSEGSHLKHRILHEQLRMLPAGNVCRSNQHINEEHQSSDDPITV